MKNSKLPNSKKVKTITISIIIIFIIAIIGGVVFYQKYAQEKKINAALEYTYQICEIIEAGNLDDAKKEIKSMNEFELKVGKPILIEKYCSFTLYHIDLEKIFITDSKNYFNASNEIDTLNTYAHFGEFLDRTKQNKDIQRVHALIEQIKKTYYTYKSEMLIYNTDFQNEIKYFIETAEELVYKISNYGSESLYLIRPQMETYLFRFSQMDLSLKEGEKKEDFLNACNGIYQLVGSVVDYHDAVLYNQYDKIDKISEDYNNALSSLKNYIKQVIDTLEQYVKDVDAVSDLLETEIKNHSPNKYLTMPIDI